MMISQVAKFNIMNNYWLERYKKTQIFEVEMGIMPFWFVICLHLKMQVSHGKQLNQLMRCYLVKYYHLFIIYYYLLMQMWFGRYSLTNCSPEWRKQSIKHDNYKVRLCVYKYRCIVCLLQRWQLHAPRDTILK